MPSSVAAGKKGVRNYLRTTPGLTSADEVVVRSADPLPEEMAPSMIVLGSVTVSEGQAGLQGRAETVTVSCWAIGVVPGNGEDAIDAARDRADELFGLARAAFTADPSAGGTVLPPGQVTVTAGGLEESPALWGDGNPVRRADRAFSITWTSHTT